MNVPYTVILIDGPRHGHVIEFTAWPGLILFFPVSFEDTIMPPPPEIKWEWPRAAEYFNWARIGNILVFKFEGIK
jgi:hypothetical protein